MVVSIVITLSVTVGLRKCSLINLFKQQAGIDFNPDQEGLDLFAKLIVEECARFMDEYADRTGRDLIEHFEIGKENEQI
jgi:hypothetical protein